MTYDEKTQSEKGVILVRLEQSQVGGTTKNQELPLHGARDEWKTALGPPISSTFVRLHRSQMLSVQQWST